MTKKQQQLLRKLIKHLRDGNLIHEEFSYASYNSGLRKTVKFKRREIPDCGYLGCAVGELPALDKRFSFSGNLVMAETKEFGKINMYLTGEFAKELGLSIKDFRLMFIPNSEYGIGTRIIKSPGVNATKLEVADHIENVLDAILDFKETHKTIHRLQRSRRDCS